MVYGKSLFLRWMKTGGTPISGNLQIFIYLYCINQQNDNYINIWSYTERILGNLANLGRDVEPNVACVGNWQSSCTRMENSRPKIDQKLVIKYFCYIDMFERCCFFLWYSFPATNGSYPPTQQVKGNQRQASSLAARFLFPGPRYRCFVQN